MGKGNTFQDVAVNVLIIAGLISIPIVAASYQRQRTKPVEQEFVCYFDGKLSERHAGVASAEEKVSGPAWKITYVEGGYAIYAQQAGESCQTETIVKK